MKLSLSLLVFAVLVGVAVSQYGTIARFAGNGTAIMYWDVWQAQGKEKRRERREREEKGSKEERKKEEKEKRKRYSGK